MLKVMDLCFEYNDMAVLKNIGFSVEKGHILSIVGPNGAGKTTLLKSITGILKPSRGRVVIDGQTTDTMSGRDLARKIGYVPQNLPIRFPITVFDSVLTGRRPYLAWRPSQADVKRTAEVIEELNLGDLAMRSMHQLSGGQAQKVLLARALVQETPYLVLDEPTSSLDLRHQLEILELIGSQAQNKAKGVILAMHDLNLAARFSSLMIMLHHGRIFCSGTPQEVMTPGNILEVYDVDAAVHKENGHLFVHPLRCCGPKTAMKTG